MKVIIQQITDLQIQLLLARIAELQVQIAELIARQSTQATQLGAVSTKVDAVVVQTAPIVVPVPVVTPPTPQISFFNVGGYKSGVEENTFNFKSNVPVDVSKTEFWIDGEKKVVFILSSKELRDGSIKATISPSLFTFVGDELVDGEQTIESFQVKLVTSDGKILISTPVRYRLSTFNGLSAEYFKVE